MIAIMRHPGFLQSFSVSRVFVAALLIYLTAAEQDSQGDYRPESSHLAKRETVSKAEHNNDWWSWNGEWGRKKRSIPDTWEMHGLSSLNAPIVEKKAWQRLQNGWGKRGQYQDDDTIMQDTAVDFDPDDQNSMQNDVGYDLHEDDKRNWRKFNDGWGKRNSKWNNFGGSWGKRDPAWSNLKGIWGKRSSLSVQN